jgi:hypothetical protein
MRSRQSHLNRRKSETLDKIIDMKAIGFILYTPLYLLCPIWKSWSSFLDYTAYRMNLRTNWCTELVQSSNMGSWFFVSFQKKWQFQYGFRWALLIQGKFDESSDLVLLPVTIERIDLCCLSSTVGPFLDKIKSCRYFGIKCLIDNLDNKAVDIHAIHF